MKKEPKGVISLRNTLKQIGNEYKQKYIQSGKQAPKGFKLLIGGVEIFNTKEKKNEEIR